MNWQSIAAIAIVLITIVIFVVKASNNRGKPGCGGSCGCGK